MFVLSRRGTLQHAAYGLIDQPLRLERFERLERLNNLHIIYA
jgi:hypothetical protein